MNEHRTSLLSSGWFLHWLWVLYRGGLGLTVPCIPQNTVRIQLNILNWWMNSLVLSCNVIQSSNQHCKQPLEISEAECGKKRNTFHSYSKHRVIVFCIKCEIPVLSNTLRETPQPPEQTAVVNIFSCGGAACRIPGPNLRKTSHLLPPVEQKLSPEGICVFRPSAWCLVLDQELAERTNHQQTGWKKTGPRGREQSCSMAQNLILEDKSWLATSLHYWPSSLAHRKHTYVHSVSFAFSNQSPPSHQCYLYQKMANGTYPGIFLWLKTQSRLVMM